MEQSSVQILQIRKRKEFWHLSVEENVHLPCGYIEKSLNSLAHLSWKLVGFSDPFFSGVSLAVCKL